MLLIDVLDRRGRADPLRLPLYDTLLEDAEATMALIIGYLRLLGAAHARQVVFIADGASGSGNAATRSGRKPRSPPGAGSRWSTSTTPASICTTPSSGQRGPLDSRRALPLRRGSASAWRAPVNMAREARLAVHRQRASVRIAPPTNRTRFLMYAPTDRGRRRRVLLGAGPKQFAEFFPHIDEGDAIEALGGLSGARVGGEALDERLDQIERFLTGKFQQADANGG